MKLHLKAYLQYLYPIYKKELHLFELVLEIILIYILPASIPSAQIILKYITQLSKTLI